MLFNWIIFLFLSQPILSRKDCGIAEKCSSPFENLRDLFICRVSNAMSPKSLEKVFKTLVTQYCNGKSLDQIGSKLENILMASGDIGLVSRGMTLYGPFEECIQSHNMAVSTVLKKTGEAVKIAFKDIFDQVIQISAPYKGRCNDPELFTAIGNFACPLLTHEMIQKLFTTVKSQVGPTYECFKPFDKKLLFLSTYGV